MGRAAIQAEKDTISGGGPSGAGVGTVETNGILAGQGREGNIRISENRYMFQGHGETHARKIFEFTKLCVLVGSGDADASATSGGDGAVGFNVT